MCFPLYNSKIIIKISQTIANIVIDVDVINLSLFLAEEKTDMFLKFLQENDPKVFFIERDTTMAKVLYLKTVHLIFKMYFTFYSFFYLSIPSWIVLPLCAYEVILIGLIYNINNLIKYSIVVQSLFKKTISVFDNILKLSCRLISNFVVN